ncbi:E3 SUMO-protein ligase ZBED1 [Halotydeus destructor]|nr:E3 SUMO-protein ligase ZBED1 [Halotydeus destructor]
MEMSEEERQKCEEAAIASVDNDGDGGLENEQDMELSKDQEQAQLITDGSEQFSAGANVKVVKVVPLPHARSEVWSYFGFIADDDGEIQDKKKAICKICATTLSYSGNTTNLFTHLKAMHPEANPQKLAPTNRTPRTGKKGIGKRKFFETLPAAMLNSAIALSSAEGQGLILKAVTYNQTTDVGQLDDSYTNGSLIKQNNSPVKEGRGIGDDNSDHYDGSPLPQNVVSTDEITNSIVNMLVKDCRPIAVVEGKGFQDLMRLVAPGYTIPDTKTLEMLLKKRYEEFKKTLILRGLEENDSE